MIPFPPPRRRLRACLRSLLLALTGAWCLAAPLPMLAADGVPAVAADTFVFSGTVHVDQPVTGDLIAAGGSVRVDAPVAGNAFLAGGSLRLSAPVAQSLYATGGQVMLDAPVGHHLRVGGGQVELAPAAEVGGNVTIGGGQVTLRGPVRGSVRVGGGQVRIDGVVDGDVFAGGGRLSLGPNARLGGRLSYRSQADLVRDPAAQVAGPVEAGAMPGFGRTGHGEDRAWNGHRDRASGVGGVWTLGLMLLAGLVAGLLPGPAQRVADTLRTRFGASLLWGFIALVCIPVATLLLFVTVVGIPLGLLALLLYPVLLLLGYVGSALGLGQWVHSALRRRRPAAMAGTGWRVVMAVAAVLVLAVLGQLPFVGGVVALLAVMGGTGALALLAAPRQRAAG